MNLADKRIRIITGHYGSGKTEFAINYCMKLREQAKSKIFAADLDVVNVYFRIREKKKLLKSLGIELIESSVDADTLDIPALSSKISQAMRDKEINLVMDIGGDPAGARALASLKPALYSEEIDLFFVINANRPQTIDAEQVLTVMKDIENTCGLKVTALVNNTHLGIETTLEDILRGQRLCEEVSKQSNIPIRYIVCEEKFKAALPLILSKKLFPITLCFRAMEGL